MTTIDKTAGSKLITDFISAINARNAVAAESFLESGFVLTLPGPTTFNKVQSFLNWAAERYSNAIYCYDDFDVVAEDREITLVYASGTFNGELNNGERFANIRFVDRFRIKNKKILTKETWSDMAEYMRRRAD